MKCGSGFVHQALSLPFHPFLLVVFHILLVFPTTAVCPFHRWRVTSEIRVAAVIIKRWHVALQALGPFQVKVVYVISVVLSKALR